MTPGDNAAEQVIRHIKIFLGDQHDVMPGLDKNRLAGSHRNRPVALGQVVIDVRQSQLIACADAQLGIAILDQLPLTDQLDYIIVAECCHFIPLECVGELA